MSRTRTTSLICLLATATALQRGRVSRSNVAPAAAQKNTPYVPGTPGADWSQEEMDAIGKTLFHMFEDNQGKWEETICGILDAKDEDYSCRLETFDPWGFELCNSSNASEAASPKKLKCEKPGVEKYMSKGAIPDIPKILRLVFHDCVRYTEGGGGCDGCLDFYGVFTVKNIDEEDDTSNRRKADYPFDLIEGDNNNLVATADILENIYTNVMFGYQSQVLSVSLRDSGKSRADLWAFAALKAVAYFVDRNNAFCQNTSPGRYHPYSDLFRDELGIDFPCEISGMRDMQFYTGRKDCVSGVKPPDLPVEKVRDYQTWRHEHHPNPHANGAETVAWMQSEFGLNGRETVAIFGAHGVGKMSSVNTMFRYTWVGRELANEDMLNNLYYRVMAFKPQYTKSDMEKIAGWKATGDPMGNPAPPPSAASFMMNPRCVTPSGGPIQWFMNLHPQGSGQGGVMQGGGTHLAYLNPDMGLYLSFDTTEGGYPIRPASNNCTSLATKSGCVKLNVGFEDASRTCLQTIDGGDGTPLYKIVEEYADDQEIWYHDFTLALEKFLSNGYGPTELNLSGTLSLTSMNPEPPTDCTSNWCCGGIINGGVCCAGTCGKCGGSGCQDRFGGPDQCCSSNIKDANRQCEDKFDTACVKDARITTTTSTTATTTFPSGAATATGTPATTTTTTITITMPACSATWCCGGFQSKSVCCAASCGSCGGSGCKHRLGGKENCCTRDIKDANRECEGKWDTACVKEARITTTTANTTTSTTATTTSSFPSGAATATATPATTTTTTITITMPACSAKWCCGGFQSKSVCCAASCGSCGGSGCQHRLGGKENCCTRDIKDANRECEGKWDTVCVKEARITTTTANATTTTTTTTSSPSGGGTATSMLPTTTTTTTTTTAPNTTTTLPACSANWCCTGFKSKSVCCAGSCGGCGGSGCQNRPGGKANCCTRNIKDANRKCEGKYDEVCLKP